MAKTEMHEALDTLFTENSADQKKNQSYKDNFKEYELPDKYFLIEMYNKQKELQQFLADRGKTEKFPNISSEVTQPNVQLAIYHLFCMQIEFEELKVELMKLKAEGEQNHPDEIDARYELIDMFFFMFNVGIYTGLDILKTVDLVQQIPVQTDEFPKDYLHYADINYAITNLMSYIDKLPWKAWKEYDYSKLDLQNEEILSYYANALNSMVRYAKHTFNESDKSLFDLYMNKWEENERRQLDKNSGYILNSISTELPAMD